jgi:hypothetical protein
LTAHPWPDWKVLVLISSLLVNWKHVLIVVFVGAWALEARAQEFRIIGGGRFAEIGGAIEPGGGERFRAFLTDNPGIIGVRLSSPGGTVVSAIAMAEEISSRRLSTFIAEGSICASACSILFFAGHDRLVLGRLGLHQMDDGGRSNASTLQFVLAEQLDAFQKFDVPWELTKHMLTTPPWDMYWVTPADIENFALNRDRAGDAIDTAAAALRRHQPTAASFADFPTFTFLSGTPRLPDFDGRDADYRLYRTRIRDGAAQGANFAGHYSMVEIGCGTSCRFAFVVDLLTGTVGSFPYGGEEQYQMGLLFSPDSRLLRVRWSDGWDSGTCTEKDLLIEGLVWNELAQRSVPAFDGHCGYH